MAQPTPEELFAEAYDDARKVARGFSRARLKNADDSCWTGDLEGAALERLWQCALRYDPAKGCSWTTYWRRQVPKAMIDELRRIFPGTRDGTRDRIMSIPDVAARADRPDTDPEPEEVVLVAEALVFLESAVASLTEPQQAVVNAARSGRGSLVRVAEAEGVSLAAVDQRRRRIKDRMAILLRSA